MPPLTEYARPLLVAHAVLGAALVAASTHLVVWMRGYLRGRYGRLRAIRRFAAITAALYALAFVAGNLLYPIYKTRVRTEFLDDGTALVRSHELRSEARARARADRSAPAAGAAARQDDVASLPAEGARVARWFDVKEHWSALGLCLSVALAALVFAYDPKRHGGAAAPVAFALAAAVAGSTWLAAIVGLVVTSYRSVAPL